MDFLKYTETPCSWTDALGKRWNSCLAILLGDSCILANRVHTLGLGMARHRIVKALTVRNMPWTLQRFKGIVQRKLRWVEIGIALVLGCWTFFFNFKRPPSWFSQITFCRHLSPNYWYGNVGKNRWSAENGVWRLSICRNMVLAPIGVALYGV